MNILIGGAWPNANESLHIGHLAGLLPGDILARYHRAKGDTVTYVSGSDCHGTPITLQAKQTGRTPREISEQYHAEFVDCFHKLGFSYDLYGRTSDEWHTSFVQKFHKTLYEGEYIYEKTAPQSYCPSCSAIRTDRFVIGLCPVCGEKARGEQCDACGEVLEPESLHSPTCAVCQHPIEFIQSKHLYIALSRLEDELRALVDSHPQWRKNAIVFTNRYLNEGLRDRAVTRSLDWGIEVPKEGYEDKKIYVWAENVLGYLSASHEVALHREENFDDLWGENAKHYYVHGKDNIPFHTIILPALLLAHGRGWHLPDSIVSSEHLTLEGRKLSKSLNWTIKVKDLVERYHPDSLRYFFLASGPEKRDTDFTWREYINSHNGELLGAYGNFVNRTLAFLWKYGSAVVPNGTITKGLTNKITSLYQTVGKKIEETFFKEALDEVFEFVRFSNRYYDSEKPWETRLVDPISCNNTLFVCTQLVANLSKLLAPFLPFSSEKVSYWLKLNSNWAPEYVPVGFAIPEPELLFERLDKKIIEEEQGKIGK